MSKISIQLTPDRTVGGLLLLYDSVGNQVGNGLSVLGKAAINTATVNGNPTCDPNQPFGDTPTGTYNFIAITDFVPPYDNPHSYGINGVIKLDPTSGNAAIAKANGRTGILIHGGDLGPGGMLRRTNGCLRLRDDEFYYLKDKINNFLLPLDPITSVEVLEIGTPSPISCDTNSTCDEGDPPPGF